jgi:hypothetical protein
MTASTILMCIGIAILAIAAAGILVMLLWNWLIPQLFKGPVIRFKHALGLLALSFLLTGGLHGGRHWNGRHCGMQDQHCTWHQESCSPQDKTTEPKN